MGSMAVPAIPLNNLSQQFDLLGHELVVDNFAGGGGATEGIQQALGRPVDLAINHDPTAIAVHAVNHPGSEHSVADVWDIRPEEAVAGRPVGLAWFSPDCRHHSRASGGRPVSKSVRGLAWVAVRWAATVKPRVICLENVSEFQDWGPLIKNEKGDIVPDPKRKGQTFWGFVRALKRHGYKLEWKTLSACDYGAPTIRNRFFLIARRDGIPVSWPKPTHADPTTAALPSTKLKPWRSAAECIDWSIGCPSIFDRKKPLAVSTLRRIAKGVMRFVVESDDPFLVPDNARAMATSLVGNISTSDQQTRVASFLAKHYTGVVGCDLRKPTPTVTATDHNSLVSVSLVNLKGSERGGRSISEPLPTVCAGGTHAAIVAAFLAPYYGSGSGETGRDLNAPTPTITTKDRFQLITVVIDGQNYVITDIGMRMLQPHELAKAQGFPVTYQLAEANGRKIPKYRQVRLIGNSVCPPLARAIVEANFGHERKYMPYPQEHAA